MASTPGSPRRTLADENEQERIAAWIAGHFRELELERAQLQGERDDATRELRATTAQVGELKTLVGDLCRKMTVLKKEKGTAVRDLALLRQAEVRHNAHDVAAAARHKRMSHAQKSAAATSKEVDPLTQLQKRNTMLSSRVETLSHNLRAAEATLRKERSQWSKKRIAAESEAEERVGHAEAEAAMLQTRVEERDEELNAAKLSIDELGQKILAQQSEHTDNIGKETRSREAAEARHAELVHKHSVDATSADALVGATASLEEQIATLEVVAEEANASKQELARRYYALEARLVEQAKVLHTERTALAALKAKRKEDVRRQRIDYIRRVDRHIQQDELADAAEARQASRGSRARRSRSARAGGKSTKN